jgi:hypothetical protein
MPAAYRGEAAGEELGTYPVDRLMVNVGTVARSPYLSVSQAGSGKACRLLQAGQLRLPSLRHVAG